MGAEHIVDLDFQIVLHAAGIDILKHKGIQRVICFAFQARSVPGCRHVFADALRDDFPLRQHFLPRNILGIVKVNIHGQTRQIEDGEIDGGAALQRERFGQQSVAFQKSKHVRKAADFFKGVAHKAQLPGLPPQRNAVKLRHDMLPPYPVNPSALQAQTASISR